MRKCLCLLLCCCLPCLALAEEGQRTVLDAYAITLPAQAQVIPGTQEHGTALLGTVIPDPEAPGVITLTRFPYALRDVGDTAEDVARAYADGLGQEMARLGRRVTGTEITLAEEGLLGEAPCLRLAFCQETEEEKVYRNVILLTEREGFCAWQATGYTPEEIQALSALLETLLPAL